MELLGRTEQLGSACAAAIHTLGGGIGVLTYVGRLGAGFAQDVELGVAHALLLGEPHGWRLAAEQALLLGEQPVDDGDDRAPPGRGTAPADGPAEQQRQPQNRGRGTPQQVREQPLPLVRQCLREGFLS